MFRRSLLMIALLPLALRAGADEIDHQHQALPAAVHPSEGRKYARDRFASIDHLALDVRPDFAKRTIHATAALTFRPIAEPLTHWELDAVGLHVEKVTLAGGELAEYHLTDTKLQLSFKEPIAVGAVATVTITYHVQPENGLYFRTPEMGYKQGDTQLWTQGEAEMHRYWFPCYDYPNQRFTSEITCHVPEGMSVISNGKLAGQEREADGLVAWHWRQDKTLVNYLVALAAGYFHKIEDKLGDIPLAIYTPPSEKEQAANAFLDTKLILDFYQREIGVPFAWAKYSQVYCLDFLAGGMENTSCTFQASSLLYNSATEQIHSLRGLDAHEAAHQWFGDLVTCRDWSNLWLNEGFATYYADLYEGEKMGHDAMLYNLWHEAQRVIDSQDTRPIVWRDYKDPMEQFDSRAYPKGAWVLHMIRSRLGPDLYRRCIKAYVERYRQGVATTDELMEVFAEKSGLSFDQFADQWLFHGGVPEVNVRYAWDPATHEAKLTVRQTQKVDEKVPLFRFDLPVRFEVKGQVEPANFKVTVSKTEEEFYFTLPSAPELVRIDPDFTVLMKLDYQIPPDMLHRQLHSDVIGRLLAVDSLAGRTDAETIGLLAKALHEDTFYGVRSEAAKVLKRARTPEARDALAHSLAQPDARVRLEVVEALAAYPGDEAQQALDALMKQEKNPDIIAAVVKTWSTRPLSFQVAEELRKKLDTRSYHNVISVAAIATLRAQDEGSSVPLIMEQLLHARQEFSTFQYEAAIDAMAFLARRHDNPQRDNVRRFLIDQLSNPKPAIRVAAAKSLGTLGDIRAVASLEPLTKVVKAYHDPLREAAEKSIQTLQAANEGSPELKNVWEQMQQLQRKTEELQKEVDRLHQKAEAQGKPAPAGAPKS